MFIRTRRRHLVVAGLLSLTTACGSTVQVPSTMLADPGLARPGLATPGLATPGSSTAVPGSSVGSPGTATTGLGPSAAGGSRASSDVGTSGSTSLPAAGSGSGHTPTAVRGPLEIGFLYPSNGEANSALGITTSASNDPKSIMKALVAALNDDGGLAGRKLVVDYYATDANSSDYSTQANAACAHFTQDNPVPVVLDVAFGNQFGMAACLAKHGVADFGHGTSDAVGDNAAGLFAAPNAMTSSRRYPAVISGLHATGYVTSQNKIGVMLENCPYLQRAYQQAILPEISRLGLNLVDTEEVDCATGFSSAGPASSAVQSAVLRFRSHDVDRLLMVSNYEQVLLLLIANNAESQDWRPGYMLSSTAQTEVMRPNIPSGQWPQLHGIGWSPGLDIDDPHQPLPRVDQRCLDLIKKGGVSVSGWQNVYVANALCSHVFFFGEALRESSGNPDGHALMAAVESLGAKFTSPGIVEGRTFFGSSRHDGPAAVRPFAYVRGCDCLTYTGDAFAVS